MKECVTGGWGRATRAPSKQDQMGWQPSSVPLGNRGAAFYFRGDDDEQ
jgi:hypothetical protein